MSRKLLRFVPILLIVVLAAGALPATTSAREPVKVVWFIGLGTGGQPQQQEMQAKVVEAFNASQDDVELEIVIAENSVAPDTLSTLIASGEAPDIIGPVGGDGANTFYGSWLDLQPLVDATGYDLTQFPEATVNFYRTEEGLIGLPFATFPSFVWYRPGLFDEAGLPYPPATHGELYGAGTEYEGEWNMDKVREIAMYLTVDANGFDATEEGFDADNIIQWGYANQWTNPRADVALFGTGYFAEEGQAVLPEGWVNGWQWIYDGMWKDHFYPTDAQVGSDLLGAGNVFSSKNLAMTTTHMWYTCCIEDTEWQAAANPSYNGKITARLHADTFRIYKDTKNPEAAFSVLTYLIGDASLDLLSVYGGMPARETDRQAFFDGLNAKYTQGVNWDVAMDAVNYADVPTHEAYIPGFKKAEDLLQNFKTLLGSTPDLDLAAEMETLKADLQAVIDAAQ